MRVFTFKKEERLHLKKSTDQLFKEGKTIYSFPIKMYYITRPLKEDDKYPAEVLFSVGRRNFKHAIDRNRIKRRLREIYRLQKSGFYESLRQMNLHCTLAIIFTSDTFPGYQQTEQKIISLLKRLIREINVKSEQ